MTDSNISRRRSIRRLLSFNSVTNNTDTSNNNLDELTLNFLVDKLKLYDIESANDIYLLSPIEIMAICDISYSQVQELLTKISSNIIASKYVGTALDMLNANKLKLAKSMFLSTGIIQLDEMLGGGLKVGTLIEISGKLS